MTEWLNPEPTVYCKTRFSARKVVAFDFDDSLVKRGTSDPLSPRLAYLAKDHDIVIFSNQKGISAGKTTVSEVQRLFDEFATKVSVPVSVFFATSADKFRKPATGMFDLAKSMGMGSVLWYAGDAGGRKGDFNISDLYFAHNIGVPYHDARGPIFPHDIGQKYSLSIYRDDVWNEGLLHNPRRLTPLGSHHDADVDIAIDIESLAETPTLILMVGPQAVGKSRLSTTLSDIGATTINGDTLKTKARMQSRFKSLATAGHKLITIDNTNAKRETRDEWRTFAAGIWKEFKSVIVWFNISKDASFHAVGFRTSCGGLHVPDVAIHTYFKYLVPPTTEEGHLIEVNSILTGLPDEMHRFRS